MMRVKYIGESQGAFGPQNDQIYEVTEIDALTGALRVDTDPNDFNYDDDPNWKAGYLYSPTAPRPIAVPDFPPGKFYIVEDDENGALANAGVPPLP